MVLLEDWITFSYNTDVVRTLETTTVEYKKKV